MSVRDGLEVEVGGAGGVTVTVTVTLAGTLAVTFADAALRCETDGFGAAEDVAAVAVSQTSVTVWVGRAVPGAVFGVLDVVVKFTLVGLSC